MRSNRTNRVVLFNWPCEGTTCRPPSDQIDFHLLLVDQGGGFSINLSVLLRVMLLTQLPPSLEMALFLLCMLLYTCSLNVLELRPPASESHKVLEPCSMSYSAQISSSELFSQ